MWWLVELVLACSVVSRASPTLVYFILIFITPASDFGVNKCPFMMASSSSHYRSPDLLSRGTGPNPLAIHHSKPDQTACMCFLISVLPLSDQAHLSFLAWASYVRKYVFEVQFGYFKPVSLEMQVWTAYLFLMLCSWMFIQGFKEVKWPSRKKIVMGLVLLEDRCKNLNAAPRACFCISASLQQSGSGNDIYIPSFLTSVRIWGLFMKMSLLTLPGWMQFWFYRKLISVDGNYPIIPLHFFLRTFQPVLLQLMCQDTV